MHGKYGEGDNNYCAMARLNVDDVLLSEHVARYREFWERVRYRNMEQSVYWVKHDVEFTAASYSSTGYASPPRGP